ncbi:MAG: pyridoxine 5-phosphate synthase [Planctomycetota bacterium]|jgi:pyridoxine 5-phosphate synthase
MKHISLGVNVDHVATLRQARGTDYPDPLEAALAAERAGASGITVHLREDRRHIQDHDVTRMAEALTTKLNLEMAAADAVIDFAVALAPADVCLVPEKREELTTEGGLAVYGREDRMRDVVTRLREAGSRVSLFIEPDPREIEASAAVGAQVVELHTGRYADTTGLEQRACLAELRDGATRAANLGLVVNGGHGLTTENVGAIAAIPEMEELNIGHSIVCRSVFVGIEAAVAEMLQACLAARRELD